MDWFGLIGTVLVCKNPAYFPKVGVLSKSRGTFQKWGYFPKVSGLSKSGGTFQKFTGLAGKLVLCRTKLLIVI